MLAQVSGTLRLHSIAVSCMGYRRDGTRVWSCVRVEYVPTPLLLNHGSALFEAVNM